MARLRSPAAGNSVTMMAMITEDEKAPPMPWRNRPTISTAWLWATPHMTDAEVNTTMPVRKTFRRPIRSPSRPAMSRKLPKVIRKAVTTQVRPDAVKCSSFWMSGRATFTIDESRAFMNMARHTTTSAHQRSRLDRGAAEEAVGSAGAMPPFHRAPHHPSSPGSGRSERRGLPRRARGATLRRCARPPSARRPVSDRRPAAAAAGGPRGGRGARRPVRPRPPRRPPRPPVQRR